MSHMQVLIATFVLLISVASTAQTAHSETDAKQCTIVAKIESIEDADTQDETIDSVTVCDDGRATAFHSFTAPTFGTSHREQTTWNYNTHIDQDVLFDLKKIVQEIDFSSLSERVNSTETHSPNEILMRFTMRDQANERTITFHVPAIGCGSDRPKIPKAFWNLGCVFTDLYDRVKTGHPPPKNSCGCKSLHEFATGHHAVAQ